MFSPNIRILFFYWFLEHLYIIIDTLYQYCRKWQKVAELNSYTVQFCKESHEKTEPIYL